MNEAEGVFLAVTTFRGDYSNLHSYQKIDETFPSTLIRRKVQKI